MAGCGAGELCRLQSVLWRRRATARGTWSQSVVRHQLPVQLDNGLTAPKLRTDLCTHAAHTLPRFIRRGAGRHGELDNAPRSVDAGGANARPRPASDASVPGMDGAGPGAGRDQVVGPAMSAATP